MCCYAVFVVRRCCCCRCCGCRCGCGCIPCYRVLPTVGSRQYGSRADAFRYSLRGKPICTPLGSGLSARNFHGRPDGPGVSKKKTKKRLFSCILCGRSNFWVFPNNQNNAFNFHLVSIRTNDNTRYPLYQNGFIINLSF